MLLFQILNCKDNYNQKYLLNKTYLNYLNWFDLFLNGGAEGSCIPVRNKFLRMFYYNIILYFYSVLMLIGIIWQPRLFLIITFCKINKTISYNRLIKSLLDNYLSSLTFGRLKQPLRNRCRLLSRFIESLLIVHSRSYTTSNLVQPLKNGREGGTRTHDDCLGVNEVRSPLRELP